MKFLSMLFAVSLFLMSGATARAQCDCDHEIQPGTGEVNGTDLGIGPGDVVCVMAGEYEFIRFQEIRGSEEAPVVIQNCGGQVVIHNEDRAYALVVEDESSHFHITGTGDPAFEYGFDISAPDQDPWPGVGLWLLGKSTNYEVDHLEIHHTGFAGVSAKTDPICDGSADQDVFVQRNVEIHHLYVHDTRGEGFYVGSTQSDGQTINCDGTDEVHQPHFLEGINIHHNLIERTGWDGMQVGMAREGCAVWANTIIDVGSEGVEYQQQGLQIGTFSSCDVYNNVIMDGPVMGIIILGAGPSRFYNNLIVGFGEDGIYGHHRDAVADAGYGFYFNTIVDYGRNGIRVHGENLGPSEAMNNLVVGPVDQIAPGGEVTSFTQSDNLVFETADATLFAGADDYRLGDDSPARGTGVWMDDIDFDLLGMTRPDPPSIGAYEHADDTVGQDTDIPPPPEDTDTSDDGDASDDGGCSCATVGESSSTSLWTLLWQLWLGR